MAKMTKAQLEQEVKELKEQIAELSGSCKEFSIMLSEANDKIEALEDEIEQVTADRDFATQQTNRYSALYHARMTDIRLVQHLLNKLMIADPNVDKEVL